IPIPLTLICGAYHRQGTSRLEVDLADGHVPVGHKDPLGEGLTADPLPRKGFANKVPTPAVLQTPGGVEPQHFRALRILPLPGLRLIAPSALVIPRSRHLHRQGFMRPDLVVLLAKRRQGFDESLEGRGKDAVLKARLQSAVEPLDFALGLRMTNPPVDQPNSLQDQANRESRQAVPVRRAPPGGPVVHQDRRRKPVLLEAGHQGRQSRLFRQRTQRGQAQNEPAVVVQDAQRRARPSVLPLHRPLEVDLPQVVRSRALKAPESRPSVRSRAGQPPAAQNTVHRARRQIDPLAAQQAAQLSPSPAVLLAELLDSLLDLRGGLSRTVLRSTAFRNQPLQTPHFAVALEPLVARLPADPKLPAQLPAIDFLLQRSDHKLDPLIHRIGLPPGHRRGPPWTPTLPQPVTDVLRSRCYLCPEAGHPRGRPGFGARPVRSRYPGRPRGAAPTQTGHRVSFRSQAGRRASGRPRRSPRAAPPGARALRPDRGFRP